MRRPKKQVGASLDSLLDTMTNVVGILVILLTVTQLGVRDAVDRIGQSESVRPEVLEEAKLELARLSLLRVELSRRLAALDVDDVLDAEQELRKLLAEIADHQADVAALSEGREERLSQTADLERLRDEANRLLEAQKKEAQELLAKLDQSEDQLATLRAQLETTAQRPVARPKVVPLPNPRAAPEGALPFTVICRQGRAYPVEMRLLQEKAVKRAGYVITRRRLGLDPSLGIDPDILVTEFNNTPISDRYFDVTLTVVGRIPKLVLKRRDGEGETSESLQHASSRYQQRIRRINPRTHYLEFLVWPDSFETYLEARKICASRGLLAGWRMRTDQGEYTVNLAGALRVGPPPKPKPPAAPGAEPPPKPKPPARKPPPVDVID